MPFAALKSFLKTLTFHNVCRLLVPLFWTLLLTLICLYAIRPVMDQDFWWHLKTGELMLQQKALLAIDPFNYTGDVIIKGRESVILNGYWLWQLSAALLFAVWGFNGIIVLKLATATLIAWTLHQQMQRQGLPEAVRILLVTVGTVIIVTVYNLERPQVFSILFLTLLIGLISDIRRGDRPSLMLWPMMVLWANIHGGFVVGDILLGLTALGFMIQYRHDRKTLIRLVSWSLAGILASFVNPNGWNAFIEAFSFMDNSFGTAVVSEYRSSWALYCDTSKIAAISLWAISLLHVTSLLLVSRRYWPEIFISLFIIAFGLKYIRNTGFIAVSLLPVTGYYIAQALNSWKKSPPKYILLIICIASTALLSSMVLKEWRIKTASTGPIFYTFPVEMANFLKVTGLSGNLFNDYGTGGYLDWALYPQWKTFIDGRELDTKVSKHYLKIALASMEFAEGKPLYELLLDRYQIDVIAMRTSVSSGNLQPLLRVLLPNPDWTPVFQDWLSFVLVRNTPNNSAPIKQHGIDKFLFVENMLETTSSILRTNPANKTFSLLNNDLQALKAELGEKLVNSHGSPIR
jgi:hypothetical protein